jgi:hypothetical protein
VKATRAWFVVLLISGHLLRVQIHNAVLSPDSHYSYAECRVTNCSFFGSPPRSRLVHESPDAAVPKTHPANQNAENPWRRQVVGLKPTCLVAFLPRRLTVPRLGPPNTTAGRLGSGILTRGSVEKQLFGSADTRAPQTASSRHRLLPRRHGRDGGRSGAAPVAPPADRPAIVHQPAQSSSTTTKTYVLAFDGPSDTVSPCVSRCPAVPTAAPFTNVPHVVPASTIRNSVPLGAVRRLILAWTPGTSCGPRYIVSAI